MTTSEANSFFVILVVAVACAASCQPHKPGSYFISNEPKTWLMRDGGPAWCDATTLPPTCWEPVVKR